MNKFLFFVVILSLSVFGCSRNREITGEVFIVTNSGQNVKLGLVNVLAFSEEDVKSCVTKKTLAGIKEKESLSKEVVNIQKRLDELKRDFTRVQLHGEVMQYRPKNTKQYKVELEDIKKEAAAVINKTEKETINLIEIKGKYDSFDRSSFISECTQSNKSLQTLTNADGRFSLVVPNGERIAIVATSHRVIGEKVEDYYWYIWLGKDEYKVMLSNNNLFETYCSECVVGFYESL